MRALGPAGEQFAAEALEAAGCEVLARNWRVPEGELDLVVLESTGAGHELAFCEVKTRHSTRWGEPSEAVGWQKQRRLRAAAAAFLSSPEGGRFRSLECRFDVVEVVVEAGVARLEHIRDAF